MTYKELLDSTPFEEIEPYLFHRPFSWKTNHLALGIL